MGKRVCVCVFVCVCYEVVLPTRKLVPSLYNGDLSA